ncbi:MAG: tetraacyldisaccharide 4'-kinase [Bacteroidia bacterium]|nr:tetraacyldisaccharide 4'-kinase [Bacteroidia bacterium]
MHVWRRILWPFSLLFGAVVWVRNYFYDKGYLQSVSFPFPVIGLGNLNTGGSGKTPHIEYLIRLLKREFRVATLSRGYGRQTKGYMMVNPGSSTRTVGDEPMQYFSKYNDIQVAVGEDRAFAVQMLMLAVKKPQVVLMDDVYQHRKVRPGLNILLLEYESIFRSDFLLPAGNLREGKSGIKRADIIIISKSPGILVPIEKRRIFEELSPGENQEVFFSYLKYGEFRKVFGTAEGMLISSSYYLEKRFTIILVTGIANPSGIIEYLRRHTDKLETLLFPDHHEFSGKDIRRIRETFDNIANSSKIIVTTEKDAMRMRNPGVAEQLNTLPVFYLPIEVAFHQDEEKFNNIITDYVRKNQTNRGLHIR